jgi:opacity protein-like surface antigen
MFVIRLRGTRLFGIALGTLLAGAAQAARAQDSTTCHCRSTPVRPEPEFVRRSSGGVAFIQSRPLGAFGANIGFGYGAEGTYLFRLDRRGILSLRGDVGIADYGNESKQVPLSSTIGGRVQVRVSTNNYLVPMSIGPQLTWPTGGVRPYVNAGIGGQAFYTESHVDGVNDSNDFGRTTNQSDFTSSWSAGGGVYVPLSERHVKVLLDLGVQYYAGGQASYLRPGSIVDLPDSQIAIVPLHSETHLLLARVGVKIGL